VRINSQVSEAGTQMRRKLTIATALTVLLSVVSTPAAQAAWPVLNDKEVDKFVETFPGMYRIKRILAENGWDFMFWPRLQAIVRGYSLAKYEQAVSEHGENIEKFVEELKKSPWMTPEKKAELEAFYAQLKTDFASRAKQLRRQVHKNDLKVVERALPELDSVMTEVIKIEWEHAFAEFGKHAKGRK